MCGHQTGRAQLRLSRTRTTAHPEGSPYLMAQSPTPVTEKQLRDLHIKIADEAK